MGKYRRKRNLKSPPSLSACTKWRWAKVELPRVEL